MIYCRERLSWTKVLLLSLKWEVPVIKSSIGGIFRPFLEGLKIARCRLQEKHWDLQRKCSMYFFWWRTALLPMTSNIWSVFKLKGWEGQRVEQGWPAYSAHHCWRKAGFAVAWDETELRGPVLWLESSRAIPKSTKLFNVMLLQYFISDDDTLTKEHTGCWDLYPFVCEAGLP